MIGDFALLVKKDLISLKITQAHVEALSKHDLKKLIKSNATSAAFEELKLLQERHSKVKHIIYENSKSSHT